MITQEEVIKFFKNNAALAVSTVAAEAGVSPETMRKVMTGKRDLNEKHLKALYPVLVKYGYKSASQKCEVISIANHKGGTGKTMLAVHLALYMAAQGQSWTFWDVDAQCNAISWATQHEWEGEDGITIPGSGSAADLIATVAPRHIVGASHLLVDTPPAESILDFVDQHVKINTKDMVICPVNGRLSIDGAIKVAEEMAHTGCRVVLVPNLTDPRDTHAQEEIVAIEQLADMADANVEVFQMAIPRNAKYMREAELRGVPVWDLSHASRTYMVKALMAFCDWVARGAPPHENQPDAHSNERSSYNVSSSLKRRLWR
jgi:cellulose biosynthesis protein BcsQ